jgi:hypothetical protein
LSDSTSRVEASPDRAVPLEWSVHPAAERPLAAVLTVLVVMLLGVAVRSFAESSGWAVLGVALVLMALSKFFFPSRYRLSEQGAEAHEPLSAGKRLAWSEVRRIVLDRDAAWLSPFRERQARERHRGVGLAFGRHSETVTAWLREMARRLEIEPVEIRAAASPGGGDTRPADR